jgi:hypothetical protein
MPERLVAQTGDFFMIGITWLTESGKTEHNAFSHVQ